MESIFSEDEEYEEMFHKLYDGNVSKVNDEKNHKEVSMFGMSAMFRENESKKLKEDVFVRSFDLPSKSIEPYQEGFYKHKTEIVKKNPLGSNFAFFGMRQLHMNVEKIDVAYDSLRAERERMLRKIEQNEKEEENLFNEESIEQSSSASKPKSVQRKATNSSKKRWKRKNMFADSDGSSSNSSDGDDDSDTEEVVNKTASTRTRKRRSPDAETEEKENHEVRVKRRRSRIVVESSSDEEDVENQKPSSSRQ